MPIEGSDPLFKGCTRPAMIFGVPIVPFAVVAGVVVLLSIWTTLFVSLLLFPIIIIMRSITKSDDQQFRLLGLKIVFRGINIKGLRGLFHCNKNSKFWRASAYSPFTFEKRK